MRFDLEAVLLRVLRKKFPELKRVDDSTLDQRATILLRQKQPLDDSSKLFLLNGYQ